MIENVIYAAAGVYPPVISPESFDARSRKYAELASVSADLSHDLRSAVQTVLRKNEGPTVDAFYQRMQGAGSALHQFERISERAAAASDAFEEIARLLSDTRSKMQARAKEAAHVIMMLLRTMDYTTKPKVRFILETAQEDLRRLENKAATKASWLIYSAYPPGLIDISRQRPNESLTPQVESTWDSLSDEQKERILHLLAEDYAKQHGIKVPPIEIVPSSEATYRGSEGELRKYRGLWEGGVLKINGDTLKDAVAMNVIIHEMTHAVQHEANRLVEGRRFWPAGPTDFRRLGLTPEEAERLYESSKQYRNSGEYYGRAPVEIDAGRATNEFSDDLTVAKLKEYVRRVS